MGFVRSQTYTHRMDWDAVLQRVEERLEAMGMTVAELNRRSGLHKDGGVANWRRAQRKGKTFGANTETLQKIAKTLQVSENWLLYGDATGFSEMSAKFVFPEPKTDAPAEIKVAMDGRRARIEATFTKEQVADVRRMLDQIELMLTD